MFLALGISLYFKHFINSVHILSKYFQVHPEGKFVVDVDKNIDINDVSVIVIFAWCITISKMVEYKEVQYFTFSNNEKHGIYVKCTFVESLLR